MTNPAKLIMATDFPSIKSVENNLADENVFLSYPAGPGWIPANTVGGDQGSIPVTGIPKGAIVRATLEANASNPAASAGVRTIGSMITIYARGILTPSGATQTIPFYLYVTNSESGILFTYRYVNPFGNGFVPDNQLYTVRIRANWYMPPFQL